MEEHKHPHDHTQEHEHSQGHDHTQEHVHGHIEEREHSQKHSQDHIHEHSDEHFQEHVHNHGHYHENTKAVLNRLSRMIGHLEKVKDMVERGEDCSAVLVQLSAVKGAINSTSRIILKDHMEHCIVHAIEDGDTEMLEQLNDAIDHMMK